VEWCRYAGLYVANESHFARYRAYGDKISPAGLTTAIVTEFLEDNAAVMNLQEWRNYSVYEPAQQAQVRIEQTAAALEAIGASRAAAKLRALKSTSPLEMLTGQNLGSPAALMSAMKDVKLGDLMKAFQEQLSHAFPGAVPGMAQPKAPAPPDPDIESRERIEHLLQQYVTLHERELQADIDKHGDPRLAPGFTPEGRMQELDRQQRRQRLQEQQTEDVQKLQAFMESIKARLDKGTAPARLSSDRRKFLTLYRRYRGLPPDELTPALGTILERAGKFIDEHKDLFHPDPVQDPELLQRLAALGEYDVDVSKHGVRLAWDGPKGFACSWTRFSLHMEFPKDGVEPLRALLGAAERLASRFTAVTDDWRAQLIAGFRNYSAMMSEEDLEEYDLDDAGEATPESILRHAGAGTIHLAVDPDADYVRTEAHFAVDWDEEHGFDVAWEDEAAQDAFDKLTQPDAKAPEWLKLIQEGRTEDFLRWRSEGGKLSEALKAPGQPFKLTVLDWLAKDAPPAMLQELVAAGVIKPNALRDSWQRFLIDNARRFMELMPFLPQQMWGQVLVAPSVWDYPELLDKLAAAGVDFNAPVNEEGMPPLHLAVMYGKKDGVRWLIAHGADVHKADKYQRTAFMWAEHGPGFECLPLLEGKEENPAPPRAPMPDAPGIAALAQAAWRLPKGQDILVSIQIKSPPVTRVEKAYDHECHYRLSILVQDDKVTFNSMNSGRQEYLYAGKWPTFLFTPILQWPELTPLWPTLEVVEYDWAKALKKRNYQGLPRPDLLEHARSALEQAFDAEEAAARGIRLRK
jgi:hypothetical protein